MPKKGSPGAMAFMEQLVAYHKDPTQAPHKNPPKAPNADIAVELANIAREMMAIFLDYKMTGELHPDHPCPEAVLASCDLTEVAMEGGNVYAAVDEIMRRFGWTEGPDAWP